MRFDPLQRARDFVNEPHPRRQARSMARRMEAVERRAKNAKTAAVLVDTGGGGATVVEQLPDPTSEDIGQLYVVRSPAGQPGGVYVGDQAFDDTPFWRGLTGPETPLTFSFETSFGGPGTGNGQFGAPTGLAASADSLWVSDSDGNARIQKFSHAGKWIATYGPSATLPDLPGHMRYGPVNKRVGVAGTDANSRSGFQVWSEDFSTRIFQVAASGSGDGQFNIASGMAEDSAGNWVVCDRDNGRVQKFGPTGAYLSQFGSGQLTRPIDLCIDKDGNIHVVDFAEDEVVKYTSAGMLLFRYGATGAGPGQLNAPVGIAVANNGAGPISVTEEVNDRVSVFGLDGAFVTTFGTTAASGFGGTRPRTIATYGGRVWVADTDSDLVGIWRAGAGAVGPRITPVITIRTNSVSIAGGGNNGEVTASCAVGEVVTGGGCSNETDDAEAFNLNRSQPNGQGWRCRARNAASGGRTLMAHALCMAVPLTEG